ncbi:MAG TPA: TAXI family TRAP transporter solute-binding subunit [Stellaceae bacterium]|nr:TAXI family TRAP transporter solute-binding subunit [Stellaceae bacterium]
MAATRVTLATATPGGGFPLYGGVFAEVINTTDPSLEVECRNTKGSTENVPLLEASQVDLGLVTGEVAFADSSRAGSGVRILAAMYSTPGMFVVRGDSPARAISDLRGKPVAFGAAGSGLVILARYVLDGLGLEMERDFQAIYLERAGDGPAMVLDGRAAALWGGGIGWPGFARVAEEGGRFIAPTSAEVAQIRAKHPFLKPLTVPAGAYPGQSEPINSIGSWSFVLARPDLPDDAGYRLAKALHRGEAALAAKLDQAKETTAANTAAAAPDPALIQPGVARYLREIGVL